MVEGLDDNSLLWRSHITSYVLRFVIFVMMFWVQPFRDRGRFGSGTTGFYGLSVYSCSNISGMKDNNDSRPRDLVYHVHVHVLRILKTTEVILTVPAAFAIMIHTSKNCSVSTHTRYKKQKLYGGEGMLCISLLQLSNR